MKFKLSILVFLLLMPMVSASNWPMFHHDLKNTGYTTDIAPKTNQTLWTYTTDGAVQSSPAVADGMVFIGSNGEKFDGKIYALNQSNGELIWSYYTGGNIESSPAVADGMVFVTPRTTTAYALNQSTGELIWTFTFGDWTFSSPAVADGMVFFGTHDKNIYALNQFTGELIWSYGIGRTDASPVVADGMVFIGSWSHNIYALNQFTGELIWSRYIGDYLSPSSPAVADGMVFIGSKGGGFYALNQSTGDIIWNKLLGGKIYSSPAIANGVVFVGSTNGNIYALNQSTGELIWSHYMGGYMSPSPAVADGMVFMGSDNGNMHALNQSTGELIWSYHMGSIWWSSPAIADGMLLIGSFDDKVYAFGRYTTLTTPDLTVTPSDISFSNPTPSKGETVTVTATIHNVGDADASDAVIIIRFFDGNPDGGGIQIEDDQVVDSIPADGTGVVQVEWTATPGAHGIYVVVDPDNDIDELDEENNIANKTITVSTCPLNAQQTLLQHLNYRANYDFYEEYYDYDDDALSPDDLRDCYLDLEDGNTWINRISTSAPALYPCSAAIIGPEIGVDTNTWYDSDTSVKGIYYPELEIESIDEWMKDIPFVGEDLEDFLEEVLEASEFSINLDGIYSQAPIEYEEETNKAIIATKFGGRVIGPGIEEGGNCQGDFIKYYDANDDEFGDTLPEELTCAIGIGLPVKTIGYSKEEDIDLELISFEGTITANVEVDPSASAGVKFKFGEPQATASAGETESNAELNALIDGEVCLLDCSDISASLPTPTMEDITVIGEAVNPLVDFGSGDQLESIFPNPSGNYVVYEDLDYLSPVIRIATSPIVINYELCFNLTELDMPCEEMKIPCYICALNGTLLSIDSWQGYWSLTEITVYSPVDIHLYDENGRHVGPNTLGGIDLEVPQSQYLLINDTKRLIVPTTTDKFILILNGTDDGSYNMTISRPIMIFNVSGYDLIKGVTYRIDTVKTDIGNRDYYNLNFDEIEKDVNEKVRSGTDVSTAIEEALGSVVYEHDISKLPTALFVSDVYAINDEWVTLNATSMSLDKALEDRTIIFRVDEETIGQSITNEEGEANLQYHVPEDASIGLHTISAIYEGDDAYMESEGYASLRVINQPPEVWLDLPSAFVSGTVWISGNVTDLNLKDVILNIDGMEVANSVPYLWDTTTYTDGLHTIKLKGIDELDDENEAVALVIVDNSPPEAHISYDPDSGDLIVEGIDNLDDDVDVSHEEICLKESANKKACIDEGQLYTLTDDADNRLLLEIEYDKEDQPGASSTTSIQLIGAEYYVAGDKIKIEYEHNWERYITIKKQGEVKIFEERIHMEHQDLELANYNMKKNETMIIVGGEKEVLSGLHVIDIITDVEEGISTEIT
ncbi:MAG: PQQ-binding-like beta-propeller repeat protein [Candidatus Altiarchaeales archaeon]|nr:PQQ-binding-like beta-propeller repeat protein [Candidatus Altiarchaeota archaeon]MBU4436650.1 PQQ-binding-like beta-propeller repeat protein [Candidatus Altiarchaeota archaeon]MCG2783373.1 PQQ-binding-like beta-propeller repeat protein [Candidatus Altiarchaeales archaeon]